MFFVPLQAAKKQLQHFPAYMEGVLTSRLIPHKVKQGILFEDNSSTAPLREHVNTKDNPLYPWTEEKVYFHLDTQSTKSGTRDCHSAEDPQLCALTGPLP